MVLTTRPRTFRFFSASESEVTSFSVTGEHARKKNGFRTVFVLTRNKHTPTTLSLAMNLMHWSTTLAKIIREIAHDATLRINAPWIVHRNNMAHVFCRSSIWCNNKRMLTIARPRCTEYRFKCIMWFLCCHLFVKSFDWFMIYVKIYRLVDWWNELICHHLLGYSSA